MEKGILKYIDSDTVVHEIFLTTDAELVSYDNNGTDTTVANFLNNLSFDTAETADVAEKAEKDLSGNVITSTYAPKNSPNFTGTPTAPTASDLDLLTNQIATVAWCNNVFKRFTGIVPENMDTLQEFWDALGHDSDLATTLSTELAKKQDKTDKLTAFSNLSLSADKLILATGENSFSTTALTSTGKNIISASTAKEIRKALGVHRDLFLDEIEVNRWLTIGNPTVSNTYARFNHAAQFANNQGIYPSADITYGGADFTISFWGYMDNPAADWGLFLHSASSRVNNLADCIMLGRGSSDDALMFSVFDSNSTELLDGGTLLLDLYLELSPIIPVLGTFRHYEIDYKFDTQTIYLFTDGTLAYTKSGVNIKRVARYVALGLNNTDYTHSLVGAISEFRLQDGICEHTSNFTPPTEKYEVDEHTLSLLHFD